MINIKICFIVLLSLLVSAFDINRFARLIIKESDPIAIKISSLPYSLKENGKLSVGIVGAGISGLYAALLLQDLDVEYEIFEASNRFGGRFFTYHFSAVELDYVDLGAMRLPKIKSFDRFSGEQNWSLVNYCNSRLTSSKQLHLIPIRNKDDNTFAFFNGIKVIKKQIEEDRDSFALGVSNGGVLPDEFAQISSDKLFKKVMTTIREKLSQDFENSTEFLLRYDNFSFAEYLMQKVGFPREVVDWLEISLPGSGTYSLGFVDIALYQLLSTEGNINGFFTVKGGFSKVIEAMVSILRRKPLPNAEVKAIKRSVRSENVVLVTNKFRKEYNHVILTPTFSAMNSINMSDINLSLAKKWALRLLHYKDLMKVAFKFKSRFWSDSNLMNGKPIFGGSTSTDLPIRTIVYPSYNNKSCNKCPGVLIVSYPGANDATRLSQLSNREIEEICLNYLVEIHGEIARKEYTGKYIIQRWGSNRYTLGAVPIFYPGHSISLYPRLIVPEMNGKLHFAGDTVSMYHGWSIAALISAYRAVYDILKVEKLYNKIEELKNKWGTIKEPSIFDV